MTTINGTNGNDNLFGGLDPEVIMALDGDDIVSGGGGNDSIFGGNGNDSLSGDDGADYIEGGAGADSLSGGDGQDTIHSGAGDDSAWGDADNDTINGDDGHDHLYGGDGNDFLVGGYGGDVLEGGDGADRLAARANINSVPLHSGGAYVLDTDGSAGTAHAVFDNEEMYGGGGDDQFWVSHGTHVDGGSGVDIVYLELIQAWYQDGTDIDYGDNYRGVDIDLAGAATGTVTIPFGDYSGIAISLTGVEQFAITFGSGGDRAFGGALDDWLTGDAWNHGSGQDELHGAGGNDTLNGGGKSDQLYGDAGDDTLEGGGDAPNSNDEAPDGLHGGDGNDLLTGRRGDDLDGGADFDTGRLTLYDTGVAYVIDMSLMFSATSVYDLGDGTTVVGMEAYEYLGLGWGNDIVLGSSHADVVYGYNGNDTLSGADGDDQLRGEGGDDVLNGQNGADYLDGSDGADTLDGGAGIDALHGWNGNDIYYVDNSGDVVVEGAGRGTDEIRTFLAAYSLVALTNVENLTAATSGAHDLRGNSGNNVITGGVGNDLLRLYDGGNDVVIAGAGNDNIFFGGSLNASDTVTGGDGTDTLVIQGNYAAGLTLTASVTQIENISMLAGSNTVFGEPGTNRYDYVITTHDANFAAGLQVRVNGSALLAGEDFTFDGSAETDAKYVVYGGKGVDTLIGGLGADIFFYPEDRFASGDTVNGGAGYDGMFLRGNYTIDFNAPGYTGLFTNIENFTLSSATDVRYATGGGSEFDYDITFSDAIVGAGQTLTVSGTLLLANETMIVDGSQESDGLFRFFAGKGDDALEGGALADLFHGNLGADDLAGGGGADTFRYDSIAESNSSSLDHIFDFTPGTDELDLSRVDANSLVAGDQAFTWIGSSAFSATAGQLRAYQSGSDWFLEGDVDGNGVGDLVIALTLQGSTPLGTGDFIL